MVSAQVDKKKTTLPEGVQDSLLGTSLLIKENAVVFSKTYASELSKDDLTQRLKEFLPSVKNFQLTDLSNQNKYQFSGRLASFVVNYRKYGGSLMGTPTILNSALDGDVIIQVKDNKYRVIVSNIVFKDVSLLSGDKSNIVLDDFMTKSKRTAFRSMGNIISIGKYIDQDFTGSFDVSANRKTAADF